MLSDYVRKIRQHVGHDKIWLPAVTAVTTRSDGKFLVIRHQDSGLWVFPGGAVEFGETLEVACLRELKEETGIEATVEGLLDAQAGPDHEVQYKNGDRVAYMTAFYHCRDAGLKEPICGDEAADVAYVTLDELEKREMTRWMKRLLPLLRKKIGAP